MSNSSNPAKSSCSGNQVVGVSDFIARDRIAIERITSDPFVAPQDQQRPVPKPVDEIVRNLNGYRIMESPLPQSKFDLVLTVQPEPISRRNENVEPAIIVKKGPLQLTVVSPRFTVTSVQRLKLNSIAGQPTTDLKLSEVPLVDLPKTSSVEVTASDKEVTGGAKRFLSNEDPADPPILVDIRDFVPVDVPADDISHAELKPIPGAFQYDPDFFEHHAPQRHLKQLEALDRELTHVTAAEPSVDPQTAINSTGVAFQESLPTTEPVSDDSQSDEFGVIYAKDQQIIYIDGNEGFEFIDLTCFSIEQASFQANRIRIRTDQQEFEIDYRNVSHVLFADGQEVELACEREYD